LPPGRRSSPKDYAEDVAYMVEYLLGEGGRNVTGTMLIVDAGNTA
jgi:3-oxoacyl-[acyl-carrier protein] reductase